MVCQKRKILQLVHRSSFPDGELSYVNKMDHDKTVYNDNSGL